MKEKILKDLEETEYNKLAFIGAGAKDWIKKHQEKISQALDEYADWKIKECLPDKIDLNNDSFDFEIACGHNACIDKILSNKDKIK